MMLQQTQTTQVNDKFQQFIKKFPNFTTLAKATNEELLELWQGLGYNRRALALRTIAQIVISEYNGILPADKDILKRFPQIGHNTASSIIAFAFNMPTFFIETNIRRVFIYFFFPARNAVKDNEILPIVKITLDNTDVRNWYYALIDYGVMLKKTHPELNKKSAHYRKQSKFKGSTREIRGQILKLLIDNKFLSESDLLKILSKSTNDILKILKVLIKEGFIKKVNKTYSLA
ncbi:MAG: A/G-specific adenine glycosylase [Candidatus Thorarchaeota archaeon]